MFDVITIGTATRDVFLRGSMFQVLKDSEHLKKIGFADGEAECFVLGGKIEMEKPIFTTGGGATNAAVTFSRQGFKTGALIRIGKDESGGAIIEELKKEKVEPFTAYDSKVGTGYATILIAPSGERTVLVYRGASEGLTKKEIPFSKLEAGWAYIAPGAIEVGVIDDLVNKLATQGVMIAINPSSKKFIDKRLRGLKNILTKASVVFLNREEGAYLTGVRYDDERGIFRKLDQAVPGMVVMTDGPRGASVSDGRRVYSAGVFKGKVVDRTGAGDAFGSGFVAGLMGQLTTYNLQLTTLAPETIKYAIRLGTANATSMIESVGAKTGILTKEEFEKSKRWRSLPIKAREL